MRDLELLKYGGTASAAVDQPAMDRAGQDGGTEEESVIRGALGTLRGGQMPNRPAYVRKLVAFLAIMGPGLIVMVGDNDAGGITTYAQAGQAFGVSLLWLFPLLLVVLYVAQEMVARLGSVTGVGHARLIRERFGRFWAAGPRPLRLCRRT